MNTTTYRAARVAVAKHAAKAAELLSQIEALKAKIEESADACAEAIADAAEGVAVYGGSDEHWELDGEALADWTKSVVKELDENEAIAAEMAEEDAAA